MTTKLVILGTGGNCRDILDIVRDLYEVSRSFWCIGFLDDDENRWGTILDGVPILGPLSMAADLDDDIAFVNGIGSWRNYWRKPEILAKTRIPDERFATIIHPSAIVSRTARIGKGTVIFPHCTIGAAAAIGNHVMVLPNCIISHDSSVGDHSSVTGGVRISGGVTVEGTCYLGTGSCIRNDIIIGARTLVGMGSVVLRDLAPDSVAVGNPATVIRSR